MIEYTALNLFASRNHISLKLLGIFSYQKYFSCSHSRLKIGLVVSPGNTASYAQSLPV